MSVSQAAKTFQYTPLQLVQEKFPEKPETNM